MNKNLTYSILGILLVLLIGGTVMFKTNQEKQARLNATNIELSVEGMTCESCSNKITKKIGEAQGVYDVSVNLEAKKASIAFNPDKTNSRSLQNQIKELGYKPSIKKDTGKLEVIDYNIQFN